MRGGAPGLWPPWLLHGIVGLSSAFSAALPCFRTFALLTVLLSWPVLAPQIAVLQLSPYLAEACIEQ